MFRSKTIWFNAAIAAVGFFDAFAHTLPPGPTLVVVGAVGFVLRAVTSQPLSQK